jgi:hypothetical protein
MLQVSYFKLTRRLYGEGRRIFKMAPLHHHFELLGWSEMQVKERFWLVVGAGGHVGRGAGADLKHFHRPCGLQTARTSGMRLMIWGTT